MGEGGAGFKIIIFVHLGFSLELWLYGLDADLVMLGLCTQ